MFLILTILSGLSALGLFAVFMTQADAAWSRGGRPGALALFFLTLGPALLFVLWIVWGLQVR